MPLSIDQLLLLSINQLQLLALVRLQHTAVSGLTALHPAVSKRIFSRSLEMFGINSALASDMLQRHADC
jgi:hypothetical protein